MIKEALEYLISKGEEKQPKFKPVELKGRHYADSKPVELMEPLPELVEVSTLDGLADLLTVGLENKLIERTDCATANVFVHVLSYSQVFVSHKHSDQWGRRVDFVRASLPETPGFKFGTFLDHQSFIIGLQANFEHTEDLDYALRIASSLTAQTVSTSDDDGISQQVAVRQSIALKSQETLRGRIKLAPYRTFREVAQPVSEFVFRVQGGNEEVPKLALYEADGGKWKLDAVEVLRRYLSTRVIPLDVVS